MNFRNNRKKKPGTLMLTPMIDMFTIILVYLIVNFAPDAARVKKSDNIKLPKSPFALSKVPPIQIEVSAEQVLVNGSKLDGLQPEGAAPEAWLILSSKLKELKTKDHPILLISDKNTSYGFVDKAVGQVAAAGFSEIYFLTEEFKEGKK